MFKIGQKVKYIDWANANSSQGEDFADYYTDKIAKIVEIYKTDYTLLYENGRVATARESRIKLAKLYNHPLTDIFV